MKAFAAAALPRILKVLEWICAILLFTVYLFVFEIGLIGRRCDQQGLAVVSQLFLKGLNAARKNGVFHCGDDCADSVGLFGCKRAGPEIGRVAKVGHGLENAFPRLSHDLIR